MTPAAGVAPTSRFRRVSRRLPTAAFAFVIAALIALAVAPAVLLDRIATVGDDLVTTVLPTYDRLRGLALAMERQAVAVRGWILSGHERYESQFNAARSEELASLRQLDALVPRLGPVAAEHQQALQRLSGRHHEQNMAVVRGGPTAYQAALPQIEVTRDSMLQHVRGIDAELMRLTELRLTEEARWAGIQRTLSFLLGGVAIVAALLVGWFAARQERLGREIELAFADANRLREQADRRRDELERVTESRARLMRGFSHDVKNPLGAANGYLQLLADGLMGPLGSEQQRSIERASRSITAALHLVEDLLELARAEGGTLEIAPVPTHIGEVVRDAAEEYRAQAAAKGLELSISLPAEAVVITTDGQRVRQVLGNLISNAVKYTQSGSVDVSLTTSSTQERGGVGVTVRDTGPGIPGAQRHLLFEEFVRLDPAAGRGAGVGLTISQRIAKLLGGEIMVESEVGRGSTFTLWLPAGTPPRDGVRDRPETVGQ